MIRFMSDTRYAGLEKEMQHIPGFCPIVSIVFRKFNFYRSAAVS